MNNNEVNESEPTYWRRMAAVFDSVKLMDNNFNAEFGQYRFKAKMVFSDHDLKKMVGSRSWKRIKETLPYIFGVRVRDYDFGITRDYNLLDLDTLIIFEIAVCV